MGSFSTFSLCPNLLFSVITKLATYNLKNQDFSRIPPTIAIIFIKPFQMFFQTDNSRRTFAYPCRRQTISVCSMWTYLQVSCILCCSQVSKLGKNELIRIKMFDKKTRQRSLASSSFLEHSWNLEVSLNQGKLRQELK